MQRSYDRGSMPAGAIVIVSLAIAAVVGLIAGAVWGQTGSRGSSSAASSSPTADVASPSASASSSPSPGTSDTTAPSVTPSSPAPTGASPTGAAPAAPATTTTSADGWRLGSWRITNDGTLGVDTTARNTATGTRSATLVLYVYVNGALIATTTSVVTDVPAGATVPVHFAGNDPWQAGTKILLLQTA
jgi:cytoskeletal protein RodZ